MPVCKTCKEDKPEALFHKEKRVKSGLRPHCKECIKTRNATYSYRTPKKQPSAEAKKKWRDNNREKRNAWEREYTKRPEVAARIAPRHRANSAKRRDKLRGAKGSHTLQEWLDLCAKYGNICIVPDCERTDLTKDHVKAISRGGTNYIDNIQPMCGSHNSSKLTKEVDYRD